MPGGYDKIPRVKTGSGRHFLGHILDIVEVERITRYQILTETDEILFDQTIK
jgi:hypothetical protein